MSVVSPTANLANLGENGGEFGGDQG